jgi:hypothetical protein
LDFYPVTIPWLRVKCRNEENFSLGKFQANCPAILENIQQTNETVRIAKQGKPLVKIIPANRIPTRKFFGATGKQG